MFNYPSIKIFRLKILFPVLVLITLPGCESTGYYYQIAEGHLKIMSAREPIEDLIDDTNRSDKERKQLKRVMEMRAFAASELSLPVDDHYSEYVDLKRNHVVWNVIAAPQLSMTAHQWCFPIAGCVNYRGYFAKADAQAYADQLASETLDTYVGGVAAYSTLGWFDDPVLNTFLYQGEAALAGLLFHELSHKLLYVKDDSVFNESFATVIEIEGLMRWLKVHSKSELLEKHLTKKARSQQFVTLVLKHRDYRKKLYQSELSSAEKLEKKHGLIALLREDYEQLKLSWGGYSGYDTWFEGPLNNAQLSTVATYNTLVAGFQALLQQNDNDLSRFYKACEALATQDKKSRHQHLKGLVAKS